MSMKNWYLVYCKRGEQLRAKLNLEHQGVECYYPQISVEKIVRGKRQLKQEPLFPSYIFIRFDCEIGPTFTTIRSTRGVIDFVRQGAMPQQLQGDLVLSLKQMEQLDEQMQSEVPKKGQSLRVKSGQFAGIDAIYQEPDGETRSILLVTLLSTPVEMSIDNHDIEFD